MGIICFGEESLGMSTSIGAAYEFSPTNPSRMLPMWRVIALNLEMVGLAADVRLKVRISNFRLYSIFMAKMSHQMFPLGPYPLK